MFNIDGYFKRSSHESERSGDVITPQHEELIRYINDCKYLPIVHQMQLLIKVQLMLIAVHLLEYSLISTQYVKLWMYVK